MLVDREIQEECINLAKSYPVVTITGPRQSGKTTLARKVFPEKPYVSLEDPDLRRMANDDPRGLLESYPDGCIIDEIQRVPDLLSYIQTLVDSHKQNGKYILTGSSQFHLMHNISQSLSGRTAILKLLPLTLLEASRFNHAYTLDEWLVRGLYPRIYDESLDPTKAYRNYFETYIQRDVRQLMNIRDLRLFERFIRLCAGRSGQLFNASHLADETGVSVPTIKSWISILEASYIIFFLEPYYSNIKKRLIRSPKIYFYDTGFSSYLLNIETAEQMSRDPLKGGVFENLVILELIKFRYNKGLDHNLFFYRDSHQNEVDVLFKQGNKFNCAEIISGRTFQPRFVKGLEYFKKNFPEQINNSFCIYSGDNEHAYYSHRILNFKNAISTLLSN